MNKFISKLAKLFLGISMAAGVGVAIGSRKKDISPVSADQAGVTFSDLYSANTVVDGTAITITTGVTVTFNQGNGSNAPQYYTSGTAVRLYAKGTIVVKSTVGNITGFTITFGSSDGNNAFTASPGTWDSPSWSGSATEITLTEGGTKGNRRIAGISITYTVSSTPTISLSNSSLSGYTGQQVSSTATFTGLTSDFAWGSPTGSGSITSTTSSTGTARSGTSTINATLTGSGTVNISATGGGATSRTLTISITQTTLNITKASTSIGKGRSETLEFSHNASSVGGVSWTSDNEKVTVDSSGKVSVASDAEIDDTATITATSAVDGSVSDTCVVTVIETPLDDYDYTFTAKQFSSNTTVVLTDANEYYSPSWTLNASFNTGSYYGIDSNGRGQQIGSSSNQCTSATLSTSSFTEAISSITVYTSGYSSGTVSITVGGKQFGGDAQSYNNTNTGKTFEKSGLSQFTGTIVISWTNSSRALYVKEIVISFERAQTIHVTSIDLGDDISLAKGQEITIVPTINPSEATDQVVTFESDDESVATIDSNGKVTAVGVGNTTISGTSHDNANATDTIAVTVTDAIPKSLSWTKQNKNLAEGETIGSYFNANSNVLTVTYTDNTSATKTFGDTGLVITIGEVAVNSNYQLSNSDDGKVIKATYTEGNVSVHQQLTLTVSPLLSFGTITANFTGNKSYLLVNDSNSTFTVEYSSLNGEPAATAVSTNEDVIYAEADSLTYDSENHRGSFNITMVAGAAGTATINLTLSQGGKSITTSTQTVVVRSSDPVSSNDKYVKVTDASDITSSGRYLVVNETDSVVFNGTTNTSNSNSIVITANDEITTNVASLAAYELTINPTAKTIMNSNSKYIGGTSGSNGTHFTDDAQVHSSITIDANDNFEAVCDSTYLRYNNNNTSLFRYYKSVQQNPVQLYMFVEGESATDNESVVLLFISEYMHPEINASDKGSGVCTSGGWYTAAKTHVSSDLDNTQRLLFRDSYVDYYLRLQAWARASTETFVILDSGAIASSNAIQPINVLVNNPNTIAIIVIISVVSVGAIGGYFFIRRRKEN